MELETKRLILRPWQESDAESLYEYAKDPNVGPIAGWPVHKNAEDSREIIRTVLSAPETYAVVLKDLDKPIGSIGLMFSSKENTAMRPDEAEIGYWVGVPFWGKGYIPEAVCELLRYCFENLNMHAVWCGYYDGNDKSRRVQEKCGFIYQHTKTDCPVPLLNDVRTEHFTRITKEEWEEQKQPQR